MKIHLIQENFSLSKKMERKEKLGDFVQTIETKKFVVKILRKLKLTEEREVVPMYMVVLSSLNVK